ncbi:hypothetical protein ABPG72_010991 [Tetrahymena utriculariae]
MAICSKCKQNTHFTVKDAQQICGRRGATTTIAKLQTEDFKGIKIQKHYISEKREKRQQKTSQQSSTQKIIGMKLNLDDAFEEKAKYYWLEYLKVFHENEEEFSQEDSFDQNDQNFIEKILKQKSTFEQQQQVLEENDDINDIFRYFEDSQRANFELQQQQQILDMELQGQSQKGNNIFNDPLLEMLGKQKPKSGQNDSNYLATATQANQQANLRSAQSENQQKIKQELQGVMNSEMRQYQLQQQQQQQLEQKKKKRCRMKGKLNYIQNMEECGKNYFMLVLERSENYVKSLYNGFRSAYLLAYALSIRKRLKEHQNIESELNKSKQQFQRTKKLNEIKQMLINKSKEIKEKNKKGYLSGGEEDDQGGINKVLSKFKYENTPKLRQPKPNVAAELALEPLDLNQTNAAEDQQNVNPPRKASNNTANQNLKKSDEHVDQEKEIEELEFQFDRFQQRRVINLDEEQLMTLTIISEEIFKGERSSLQLISSQEKKQDSIVSLEYCLIPTIIQISLYSIGETFPPRDINIWIKNGLFACNLGIAPFIKIQDSKLYWLYPQSIPSSTFIRQTAKKFLAMTNHSINMSKKRILRQRIKLISDFGLPLEWACMIYQICVRLYKDKQDIEQQTSDEFDCDIIVSISLIILLKMIYGLNDEMFGVLLNNQILEEAKEYLNEKQYSLLKSIIKSFESTKFKRTNDFYNNVPTFKQVAFNIQQCIVEQKQEQVLDLTSFNQIINLSYNNLIILLQSFVDRHKLLKVHQKMKNNALTQNQQSQLSYQLMQGNKSAIKSQKMTQQAAQLQYDELEDEIQYIKQMRSHLPKLIKSKNQENSKHQSSNENPNELFFFQSIFTQSENSKKIQQQQQSQIKEEQQGPTFRINKHSELSSKNSKEYKFSSLLNSDLEYIVNKAIKQGNTSAPPCYDYEIEKSYETNFITLPNELKFVVDKLSVYTGEETSKLLHYLERIERKIYNLVKKKHKKYCHTSWCFFINDFKKLIQTLKKL